MFAKASVEAD